MGDGMRVSIFVLAVLATAPAFAGEWSDSIRRACIINSAEKLPAIPGIQVKGAEMTAIDRRVKGDTSKAALVRFAITAATIDATMVYMCAWDDQGHVTVVPVHVE